MAVVTTVVGLKEKIMNRGAAGSAAGVTMAVLASFVLAACGDRQTPAPVVTPAPATTTPSTAPPPASPPPATSSAPVIPPGTGTDVESKKGTETGMIGGESGTVASTGKPGTGTEAGAGTGAAKSSDETTENKK